MGWWYWLDVKEILLDHETLNAFGLAQSLTIEMWVHWIHLNNLEIKCIGRLEPALFLQCYYPSYCIPPKLPIQSS
jgi:hypothetical protein